MNFDSVYLHICLVASFVSLPIFLFLSTVFFWSD